MTAHTFATPPETLNHEGKPRHVGVEIEFGSVSTLAAAEKVHALFDGRLEREDQHRYHVRGTTLGDFLIELDSQYVHRVPGADGDKQELADRLRAMMDERKALQNEVASLRRELAMGGSSGGPEGKEINGIKLIAQVMSGVSGKDLPAIIDEMKARIGSGAVVLIADTGAKPAVAAGVTADMTDRISAVTLAKAAVEALGGKGGGGRPDMAQGGGADIALADAALKAVEAALEA